MSFTTIYTCKIFISICDEASSQKCNVFTVKNVITLRNPPVTESSLGLVSPLSLALLTPIWTQSVLTGLASHSPEAPDSLFLGSSWLWPLQL